MSKRKIFFFVLIPFWLLAIIPFSAPGIYAAPVKVPPGISSQIAQGGQADVLVVLDDADARAFATQMRKNLGIREDNETIIAGKVRFFKGKKNAVLSRLLKQDYTLLKDYDNFPILHLRANSRALDNFVTMTEVASISEDIEVHPFYTDSQTLIGIPQAWSYASGTGTAVAVVDSGISYSGSGLDTCSLPGDPGCIAYESCFATGGCWSDKSHGTNVSGIVFQVAPNAEVLALDVFRTDGSAYYSDIISALNWVMTNKTAYNIVAVNMSLGGSTAYTTPCASDGLSFAITTMKGAGIATVIASGNSAYTNALTSPACAPDAISVGAVYAKNYGGVAWSVCTDSTTAADKVTCFSDSASFLTMLAPGAIITAGGYTMGGTSQATPHVSGAVGVMKSLNPALTVDEVVSGLTATGKPVTDSRNNITKPRLDLAAAVAVLEPIISVNPPALSFMAAAGGLNPAGQTLDIANTGGGTLNWNFAPDPAQTWATGTPSSGVDSGTVTVSVDTSGMTTPGTYAANPQITAAGALNSPVNVPVTLNLVDPAYSEDFETGALTKFPWMTGGNGYWFVQNPVRHTGSYAAQSPVLATPQTSYLQVTLNVTSPGYVYFWLKTLTESSSWQNNLKFWLDGTNQGPFAGWYGTTDWTFAQSNIQVPAGVHTFKWEYSKTVSTDGSDAVWLDDIFFPPSNLLIPGISVLPASKDFGSVPSGGVSASQSFTVSNTGTGDLVIGTVSITGTNASDFTTQNDTCSSHTLTPSGTCTASVQFAPQSSGVKNASFTVPANYPTISYAALSGTALTSYTLTVGKGGTGSGSVSSSPAGINCGATCSAAFAQGTSVTLSASADLNSTFGGWSGGGCSGTGTCTVTMNANTAVTAIFNMLPPVANFTGSPLSGQGPLTVTFTDSSTSNPTSWSWTFGDGGTSTLRNSAYTYQTAGTFSVSLTAANAGGQNTMTRTGYVTVTCPVLPVKIARATPLYFSSLQSGYNAAANGEVVQLQAVTLTETDVLSNGTSVTLRGGFDPCYTTNAGTYSTIQGPLTISSGPVAFEHIVIQKP